MPFAMRVDRLCEQITLIEQEIQAVVARSAELPAHLLCRGPAGAVEATAAAAEEEEQQRQTRRAERCVACLFEWWRPLAERCNGLAMLSAPPPLCGTSLADGARTRVVRRRTSRQRLLEEARGRRAAAEARRDAIRSALGQSSRWKLRILPYGDCHAPQWRLCMVTVPAGASLSSSSAAAAAVAVSAEEQERSKATAEHAAARSERLREEDLLRRAMAAERDAVRRRSAPSLGRFPSHQRSSVCPWLLPPLRPPALRTPRSG
eukprot:COSAG01_NODE_537_length_15764_cov_54.273795_21_plen_262_part_00